MSKKVSNAFIFKYDLTPFSFVLCTVTWAQAKPTLHDFMVNMFPFCRVWGYQVASIDAVEFLKKLVSLGVHQGSHLLREPIRPPIFSGTLRGM